MSMRSIRHRLRSFLRSESGASALEFAIVAPVFIFLVLATINLASMAYSVTDLHFAAQRTARCVAMKSTDGVIAANTCVADAASAYTGAPIGATFVRTAAGCGNTVTATGTFAVRTGLVTLDVPLSAAACYPLQ
jgi:Flp pilus assembly protein TadG